MACTLRHSHVYSRYLSPSRLTPSSASGVSSEPVTTSKLVTPPPRRCAHSVCNQKSLQNTSTKSNSTCHIQSHRGLKTSDQTLYGARNRYMDFSSAMRVVGALNVELPKGFTLPSKLFRKRDSADGVTNTTTQVPESDMKSGTSSENDKSTVQSSGKSEDSCLSQDKPTTTNDNFFANSMKNGRHVSEREQHDFTSAMFEQDSSVKTYYHGTGTGNPGKTVNDPVLSNAAHNPNVDQTASASTQSSNGASKSKVPGSSQVASTVEGAANLVKSITSYLPGLNPQKSSQAAKEGSTSDAAKKKLIRKESSMPRSVIDRKTRGLVKSLKMANTPSSQLIRMEELCRHITAYPEAKSLAVREKVMPCLLHLRASRDIGLREQAMEALALVGHVDPVRARGIRILSLDGGGTRGLVTIEILRRLEESCKSEIFQMFDYICGVSTGSLIGIMLGAHKVPLDKAEHLYKTFSREIFQRHKLMGVGKLVMSHSYYDSELWEKILRENIGLGTFISSTRHPDTPKVASVSTLMNMTKLSNFLFRNYNHPPSAQSQLPGSSKYAFWEAIRASSAAPMYYQEYKLDEWIHQDGGIITNNPTAIAIHEAKQLWPTTPLQCVISIGTGRYEPTSEPEPSGTGLRTKVNKFIQSATDTEAVHTTLNDLLPPSTYYRFNPYMSEDFPLDEIRLDKWDQMTLDTQLYCRKNQPKIDKASRQLLLAKLPHQKAADWLKYKTTTTLNR